MFDPIYIKLALGGLALMGCLGLFFGIGLALAAHKFAVEVNPKVEAVMDCLPGANCGACGYAGCEAYSEALVNDPDVEPTLCFPGKEIVAKAIAEISGKKLELKEGAFAVVHCSRLDRDDYYKHKYIGYGDCSGATLAFAGPIDCQFGCVGLGECVDVCPVDAIKIVDNYPEIDAEECVGCGLCEKACPKNLITIIPKKAPVIVKCWCKSSPKETQSICTLGCLHCQACVRDCPADAVFLDNGVINIDYDKCLEYGPSCNDACLNACWINYPAFSKLGTDLYIDGKEFFQRPISKNPLAEKN